MSTREPFLQGQLVQLRPFQADDAAIAAPWINDRAVTHYMFYGQKPWSLVQVADHFQKLVQSENNVVLVVEDKTTHKPIGLAGLYDIHATARKAEYRILLGERAIWGKGVGTEVTELLTYYGFDRLNLNRVWLGVTDENGGGVKAYEKAGYRQEGVLRQDIYRNSQYYDTVRMSLLRDEYYESLHAKLAKKYGFTPAAVRSKEAVAP